MNKYIVREREREDGICDRVRHRSEEEKVVTSGLMLVTWLPPDQVFPVLGCYLGPCLGPWSYCREGLCWHPWPTLLPRPWEYPRSGLPSVTILVFKSHVSPKRHVDLCGLYCNWQSQWSLGPSCSQRPCLDLWPCSSQGCYPWLLLTPKTVKIPESKPSSELRWGSEGNAGARPFWCLWPMLPLKSYQSAWPALPPRSMITSEHRLLMRTVTGFSVLPQPRCGLIFIATQMPRI